MLNDNKFIDSEIVKNLNESVKPYLPDFEGNCLYNHASYFVLDKEKYSLRNNLYNLSRVSESLVQVGINGGHSIGLCLYANPKLKVLGFDLFSHPYTKSSCDYLAQNYDCIFTAGNSHTTIKKHIPTQKYDLIHIDGGHTTDDLIQDVHDCKKFAHTDTIVVIDDIPGNQDVYQGVVDVCDSNVLVDITEQLLMDRIIGIMDCPFHRFFAYKN